MSMTREEAIETLRKLPVGLMDLDNEQKWDLTEAIDLALTALRGPTREMVERMRGDWKISDPLIECQACGEIYSRYGGNEGKPFDFCPACGAPMTDEAVDMMLAKLEAMYETAE